MAYFKVLPHWYRGSDIEIHKYLTQESPHSYQEEKTGSHKCESKLPAIGVLGCLDCFCYYITGLFMFGQNVIHSLEDETIYLLFHAKFWVLITVDMKNIVYWDGRLRSLADVYRRFGRTLVPFF
jgi:hypothetical protein